MKNLTEINVEFKEKKPASSQAELDIMQKQKLSILNASFRSCIKNIDNFYSFKAIYSGIISEELLDFIWNENPSFRVDMVNLYCKIYRGSSYDSSTLIRPEWIQKRLVDTFDYFRDNTSAEGEAIRRYILLQMGSSKIDGFSYKKEIDFLISKNLSSDILNPWILQLLEIGQSSPDEIVTLYRGIKRSEGYIELKIACLEAMYKTHGVVPPDDIIKEVAGSSPINLKRSVVRILTSQLRRDRALSAGEKNNVKDREEKVEKTEAKCLLFASCADREIASELVDNLSVKNLPWILPSVSNFPHAQKRAQYRINRGY